MMHKSYDLPEHIQEQIASMPEFSYGINRVVVALKDGTEVSNVYVAWAKEIVKVGESEKVSFAASQVVSVRCQV